MTRVDEQLERYRAEFRAAGAADPRPYLESVEGADRAELAELIDGFLATAPEPEFDAERFGAWRESSRGRAAAERVAAATTESGLAELREATQTTRRAFTASLARRLGLAGREDAVHYRYHQLEAGGLEPTGVSERVWEALGELLGRSAEAVRAATPRPEPGGGVPVFARHASAPGAAAEAPTGSSGEPVGDDEDPAVDALFLGPGG